MLYCSTLGCLCLNYIYVFIDYASVTYIVTRINNVTGTQNGLCTGTTGAAVMVSCWTGEKQQRPVHQLCFFFADTKPI